MPVCCTKLTCRYAHSKLKFAVNPADLVISPDKSSAGNDCLQKLPVAAAEYPVFAVTAILFIVISKICNTRWRQKPAYVNSSGFAILEEKQVSIFCKSSKTISVMNLVELEPESLRAQMN